MLPPWNLCSGFCNLSFFCGEDDFGEMCRKPDRRELICIFVSWMIQ